MNINSRSQYAQYNKYFTKIREAYSQRIEIRESLELILSLLTISILIIFALRPTINTIAELFATLKSYQEISIKLEEKISSITKAQQVWGQEQDNLSFIDQALPSLPNPQVFLKQIEGLVGKHKLFVKSFSAENILLSGKSTTVSKELSEQEKANNTIANIKLMKFSLSFTGTYSQVSAFLEDFENLRQTTIINSFGISLSATKLNEINLRIEGNVPYFGKMEK